MTSSTNDDRMRIPKLKGAESYRPWVIHVQAALESRNVWEMVTGAKVAPTIPKVSASEALKDPYTSFVQQHASAKGIPILNIDPSILIDKYKTSLAKEIWG